LRVGHLARFELHLAECPALIVGTRCLHLARELAQLFERFAAAHARLGGILPAQIAGGVPHLLGDLAHPLAALAATGAARRLALLARLALRTGLALLTLLSSLALLALLVLLTLLTLPAERALLVVVVLFRLLFLARSARLLALLSH